MNFSLFISFIKKLSLKKLLNFIKVSLSYLISICIKKPIRWGMPYSISIEPTNYCNLHCPQCPVGLNKLYREKGFIDFNLYNTIINQTYSNLLNLFLYFQGEPFLHKDIIKLIKVATSHKIFTVISTNGHFITKELAFDLIKSGLDKIIISLDGTTQEVYQKYRRNGDLNKVINGIELITKSKKYKHTKKPFVELQFLVLKTNIHQIKSFKEICKKLKADKCTLKTAQIEDFRTANFFIPNNKKYSRYIYVNENWVIKRKLKNRCWRLWNSVVITWDGLVLPCCYDKNAKYAFGSIKDDLITNIIRNNKFEIFAKTVLTNKRSIDICNNCWY